MENSEKERNKFKQFLAPDLDKQREFKNTFKEISYYLIIGLISIIIVFVVPLISGALYGDFGLYFPQTPEGWLIYWCIRGGSAAGNVALFVLFKQQAKTNVKKHPNYILARKILEKHIGEKEFIPRSPNKMNFQEYIIKGITVLITSLGASVTISALAISFDFITFLSCIVSTIIAICFGWVTMIKNELYWTEEYLEYAKYIDKQKQQELDSQTQPETIQTDNLCNVSDESKELSKTEIKEAENA